MQVLGKWMTVIQTPDPPVAVPSAPLRTRARGQRGQAPSPVDPTVPRVPVTVFTETEELINLPNMNCIQCPQVETHFWVGKGGKTLRLQSRVFKGSKPKIPKLKITSTGLGVHSSLEQMEVDDDEDDEEDDDDDIAEIMKRADNALNRKYGRPVHSEIKKIEDKKGPNSPLKNEVSEMSTGGMNGMVKDELMDVEDLLTGDDDEEEAKPLKILQGIADELADNLEKEKEEEKTKIKEQTKQKDKENKKDKNRDKERDKDKDRERSKYGSKEEERRRREREERRRKEKERERQKEKERKEKKRESKPFKETEMRNGLDSKEREKIKLVAQRLKDESLSKKNDVGLKSSSLSSMGKIPKLPKKEEDKKDDKSAKSGLSFEALMGAMDTSKSKTMKAPPIKNKNKDLLASFSTSTSSKTRPEFKPVKEVSKDILKPMRTEDKSSKIVPASDFLKPEEKKAEKRPAESDVPKIKIKSPSQLKESPIFGDFLSTIMKDDQPKKKKIKIAELKAKTLEEEEREKEKELNRIESMETEPPAPALSFYRDTLLDETPAAGPDTDSNLEINPPGTSPKPENSSPKRDLDLPLEEPEDDTPREVRGILVLARGSVRQQRRIVWRPETELVQVEYFELDETERVNVNKLKFEEMRKKENEYEKSSLIQKKIVAEEESRPWRNLIPCDFNPPDVEYGGQSVEKITQEQRENSTLQALSFSNKLPNDPTEPENSANVRFETKMIPLDDESGEETYADYSGFPWPQPLPDMLPRRSPQTSASPQTDAIFANIHQNLQSMMGGVPFENGNPRIESAMLAAQKAAEDELRKQGLLPPNPNNQFGFYPNGQQPYEPGEEPYEPGEEPYEPVDGDYGGVFPPGPMTGGKPPPFHPYPGPPNNWNHGPKNPGNYRGNNKKGFDRGRLGFYRGRDNFSDRGEHREDRRKDFGRERRPCKFWTEKGFCRDGDRCKFPHLRR